MSIESKLAELGLTLPEAPKPVAAYVPAVTSRGQVIVSGQLPMKNGELMSTGKVPSQVSVEDAQAAARQCVLNGLAVLKAELGDSFDRLIRLVRIGAFVQSNDDFFAQPQVANGASELLLEILGDAGRHARAAVGVNALPLNASVEIEFIFEVS
ncbi:MAG: LysR family transcriptional regulator [Gammaproteobacteria bacterium TMED133]|nr:MAG: LysR family transcriptional regulator [Gammaproteobacteria bacterium TMED133]